MLSIKNLKVNVCEIDQDLKIREKLFKIFKKDINNYKIKKISIDARKKPEIFYVYELNIEIENDTIVLKKQFVHKTFEERLAGYNGEISVMDFDWGEPMGREML